MVEAERDFICKEIEKAARKGDYYLYVNLQLANENIELLKEEGYHLRCNCDEWGVGTIISWHPGKVKKKILNFQCGAERGFNLIYSSFEFEK